MSTTALFRRSLPIALAAALLVSCGASGGESKDATELSRAELRRALPTAADVGGGYKADLDADHSADPGSDAAFAKACPEVDQIGLGRDTSTNEVKADFLTTDGRTINTALKLDAASFEEKKLDAIISAINACDTVRYTDDDGANVSIDLSAERNDRFGDAGLRATVKVKGDLGNVTFAVDTEAALFRLDGIGVEVVASGSLDEQDLSSIPPDTDKLDTLAEKMVEKVRAAEG